MTSLLVSITRSGPKTSLVMRTASTDRIR